ncbi:MAG: hypothetical protein KJ630_00150 [Proteobacteria bacterium]|nr:hypothetical protein [Pseudomonadota bacterium]
MENGSILLVIIVSAFWGRRSIFIGFLSGVASTIVCFFLFETDTSMSFSKELILGVIASLFAAILAHFLFPGLKGGGHNSGPSYIGGGGSWSGRNSGIVNTEEELKNIKENEKKIP